LPELSVFCGFSLTPWADGVILCARQPLSFCANPSNNQEDKMNKNDLIAKVADLTDLSKADSNRAVDSVFDAIEQALTAGDEVRCGGIWYVFSNPPCRLHRT